MLGAVALCGGGEGLESRRPTGAAGSPRTPVAREASVTIAIEGVGFATAQGGTADQIDGSPLSRLAPLSWSIDAGAVSRAHRPARGLSPTLQGQRRLAALARLALEDCFKGSPPPPGTPLLLAS